MQYLALSKAPTHAPRTAFNLAVWQAVQAVPNIKTGASTAAIHAAILQAVPQSPHHATAHIKYLQRQKGGLVPVAAPKATKAG